MQVVLPGNTLPPKLFGQSVIHLGYYRHIKWDWYKMASSDSFSMSILVYKPNTYFNINCFLSSSNDSFVLKYDNYKSTSKSLKCSAEKVGISAPVDIQGTGNQITLDPDYVVTCTDVVGKTSITTEI